MSPNLSDSRRSRMDTHQNASLTPKGREAMARSVIEGGLSKVAAARQFNTTPKTVAKWVGRCRLAGPFIEAALIAKPDSARRLRGGRGFAKTAPYRCADRRRGRRFGGNCQPHPQTPGPQPPVGARAGRTGPSL